MKKSLLFLIIFSCQLLSGQILCIKTFEQNDSICAGVDNLILNGGFENTTCNQIGGYICPNAQSYNCDIKEWKCANGGMQTYATIYDSTHSVIPEGLNAVYFGNGPAYSCKNPLGARDTSCLNSTSIIVTGIPVGYPYCGSDYGGQLGVSLEQSVTGLIPGNIYVLDFWAGGESYNPPFLDRGLFSVDFGFGNTFLRCKSTKPLSSNKGTIFLIEFKAASSSITIKFTNWGHICATCTELVIDNVRLYKLEELLKCSSPCITEAKNYNENISVSLYPNPFFNELQVKSNNFDQMEVTLYDITSRKLLQKGFTNLVSLSTENLTSGKKFTFMK